MFFQRPCQNRCTDRSEGAIKTRGRPVLANPPTLYRYFISSPEEICLVVMMYDRFPLSLRKVEDLLFERGIDI